VVAVFESLQGHFLRVFTPLVIGSRGRGRFQGDAFVESLGDRADVAFEEISVSVGGGVVRASVIRERRRLQPPPVSRAFGSPKSMIDWQLKGC
jgi:hypothetical protein